MSFSEIEWKRFELDLARFMARRRPPPHVRHELDLAHRLRGQSVEIYSIRPPWDGRGAPIEHPIARMTFVRARNIWRLFWMRQDLKWHSYEPKAEARSLRECLDVVDQDAHACFFG